MNYQTCNKCQEEKPMSAFYYDKTNERRWKICRACKQNVPSRLRDRAELRSMSKQKKQELGIRICLRCDREFWSISNVNRICVLCKEFISATGWEL